MGKDKTCEQRINGEYKSRMADVRKLWELYKSDPEASDRDLGNWMEFGLSLDYHAPEDGSAYLAFVMSTGGPHDEIRFYLDSSLRAYSVEYVFQDWYDGAKKLVLGEDLELMREIFEDWKECGTVEHKVKEGGME